MIGQGTVAFGYYNGSAWVSQEYKYTKFREMPKKKAELGTDLAGTEFEQTLYKKNAYTVEIYINQNSTDYPLSRSTYINHLYNFYSSNRKRLSIDGAATFEVSGTDSDILALEYLEFSETLNTLSLSFLDKDRKDTDWS